jgi:hypothetical protein
MVLSHIEFSEVDVSAVGNRNCEEDSKQLQELNMFKFCDFILANVLI